MGFAQATINQTVPNTLVVAAKDAANNTVTSYNATLSVTCSDSLAIIPNNQTFTITKGVGNLTVYFGSTGTQSITVTDPNDNALNKTLTVDVVPTHFSIISSPSMIYAGQSISVVITALDPLNAVLRNIGSQGIGAAVNFTSTDSQARFPNSTVLVNGVGTFSIVLPTPGIHTVTARSRDFPQISATSTSITVSPLPTLNPTLPPPTPTVKPTTMPTSPGSTPTPTPTLGPNSTGSPYPSSFASPTTIATPPPLPDIWPQTQVILLSVIIGVCVVVIIIVTVVWSMEKNSKADLTDEQKAQKRRKIRFK
jgi:hypothetical protein